MWILWGRPGAMWQGRCPVRGGAYRRYEQAVAGVHSAAAMGSAGGLVDNVDSARHF